MSLFKRGNVWWSYFYLDGVRHQQSMGTPRGSQTDGKLSRLMAPKPAIPTGG